MATILLVDDDRTILDYCCRVLADRSDFEVLRAGSGREALEVASGRPGTIELLISDVSMPGGISGIDLAKHLTRSRPETKVLLMSGYYQEEFELGASWTFLSKPFRTSDLIAKVVAILQ